MNAVVDIKKGLEGVVVDSTSISLVDGEAGRLYYRGLPIEKLVKYPFAAVAHLVVFGDLPDAGRLQRNSRISCGAPGDCPANWPARWRNWRNCAAIPWRPCRRRCL
jgi:citrate synthase